jgi:tripartite-type tricarboxylate transporter receptor subunit TctC
MKFSRRHLLGLAATFPISSVPTRAQAYPSRPVRWIVAFPEGGPVDLFARLMALRLSERLGQPIVVENEIRAARNMAASIVAHAPSDGHTLLMIDSTNAINETLYDKLDFDFVRDIAAVGAIVRTPFVMEVSPSLPVRTVAEFIAYAQANPGKIKMASGGNGTPTHLCGEMFKIMAGIDMMHEPYRLEPPALADLITGKVQVMFGVLPVSIERIKLGDVRAHPGSLDS